MNQIGISAAGSYEQHTKGRFPESVVTFHCLFVMLVSVP